ncbi:DUF5642 family protein [Mycobacterium sp.]|uniref:DUF5642 family protein n=1 Tax=Mycobacterium sp. TaxID=1785 RepID=UPI003F996ACE
MVVLSVSALPGCARSVEGTPVVSHNKDYDISRLSQLQSEFPPGFGRVRATPVATLGPDADKFSAIGVGDVVAVDPPTCQSLIQPVRAPRDSQFTMVGGIGKGAIMVGAVNSPVPLPKTAVPAGCDHVAVTQKVSGRRFESTVTHLPGPSIQGVVTTESMTVAAQRGTKSYVFAAFLSDTVAVAVQGVLPGDPDAEDVLRDLLVKAVDVIRAA